MASTYSLIDSKILTTTTSIITFVSISQDYTDLLLKISSRNNDIYNEIHFRVNGNSGNYYSGLNLYGNGANPFTSSSSSISSLQNFTVQAVSTQTSNTFGNVELYFPNYTSSINKTIGADGVQENNSTTSQAMLGSGLWAQTSAITSIQAFPSVGSFIADSTFYLYGISNY
jgi:hypothetical protein